MGHVFLNVRFLTPFAVIFVCSLDTNNEYILERIPTNSRGYTVTLVLEFTQHFSVLGSIQRVVFGIRAGIEMM